MSGVNENITSHQNLIKINLDPSEETRDSFNENFKRFFPKNREGKVKKHFLDKKMKRTKSKQIKKNSKDNNSKIKIIQKILNDFKISSPLYKEFNQFSKIEKNVKNNLYSHYTQFAKDIRNLLSQYFFFKLK